MYDIWELYGDGLSRYGFPLPVGSLKSLHPSSQPTLLSISFELHGITSYSSSAIIVLFCRWDLVIPFFATRYGLRVRPELLLALTASCLTSRVRQHTSDNCVHRRDSCCSVSLQRFYGTISVAQPRCSYILLHAYDSQSDPDSHLT